MVPLTGAFFLFLDNLVLFICLINDHAMANELVLETEVCRFRYFCMKSSYKFLYPCSLEREEATDLIKRYGGRVTGSISKKTVCMPFSEIINAMYILILLKLLVDRVTYWLMKILVE